jgi:hypothetical protein
MRLVFLSLCLAACGSNMTMGDDEPVNCALETRADPFVVDVDAAGTAGSMDFKLLAATPATPMRNDNQWTIQVNSMANNVIGAPLEALTIVVTPYMPDHQHGNGIPVTVTAMPDAGQYEFDPLFLGMPGYWEITVDASSASAEDQHVYKICVPN